MDPDPDVDPQHWLEHDKLSSHGSLDSWRSISSDDSDVYLVHQPFKKHLQSETLYKNK